MTRGVEESPGKRTESLLSCCIALTSSLVCRREEDEPILGLGGEVLESGDYGVQLIPPGERRRCVEEVRRLKAAQKSTLALSIMIIR